MPERFNAKDALADYVTVPQRIAQFYELFGTGRLVTGEVRVEMGPDGKPRVIVQGLAYRTPEDPLPGVGWSWMELPGTTAFTRGSELENTETSAWGRAIAALGILVDRSVASANEVRAKADDGTKPAGAATDNGSLVGIVEAGDKVTSDYQIRTDPEGVPHLGFRLKGDKGGILVEAAGDLAEDLYLIRDQLIGQRVTCWGSVGDRWFDSGTGDKKRRVTYQALALSRLTGPDGVVIPTVRDAPTIPLFSEDEDAALDQAIGE